MGKEWDYSQLSHIVAEAGGPQKFINEIAELSFQRGVNAEKSTELWKIPLVALLAIGAFSGVESLYRSHKAKQTEREKSLRDKSEKAKAKFVNSMNRNNFVEPHDKFF